MPITINDCKCGLTPRFWAEQGNYYQSVAMYHIACERDACRESRQDSDKVLVAIHDWNAANPRRNNADNN